MYVQKVNIVVTEVGMRVVVSIHMLRVKYCQHLKKTRMDMMIVNREFVALIAGMVTVPTQIQLNLDAWDQIQNRTKAE